MEEEIIQKGDKMERNYIEKNYTGMITPYKKGTT